MEGYIVREWEVDVMPRRNLSVNEARTEIMIALQNMDNAVSGPLDSGDDSPEEIRKRNVADALTKIVSLTEEYPEAANQFDANWMADLDTRMNEMGDIDAAEEFVRDMKEKYNMPEIPREEYVYAPEEPEEVQNEEVQNEEVQNEEAQNEQVLNDDQLQNDGIIELQGHIINDNNQANIDNPELNENLNINQEIGNVNNENNINNNNNNNEDRPEEENREENPENQNQQNPPENQNEQQDPNLQPPGPNEAERIRREEEERKKGQKREEIKQALLEVEKALSEQPAINQGGDELYAQGIKVYGALDKLETLVNDNPGVCPEFDTGWSYQLQAQMEQNGFEAADTFVKSMKDKLEIANEADVREAEHGNINPNNVQQNVNEEIQQAERVLNNAPINPNVVLNNPQEEIAQPQVNELEEIKKQRELLQLEMEKLKLEQEKLRLERERLEAMKKEQDEKNKKNQPKKEGEEPEKENKQPEIQKPVRKPKKINTRKGIFNEVVYNDDNLIRESASESNKLVEMVKTAPVRGRISSEYLDMRKHMIKLNKFLQRTRGRSVLTAEEIQEFDRLSMNVVTSSKTYVDKKDAEREDRIDLEDRENTTKKFKTDKAKRSYMQGYKSEVEMDRTNIVRNVNESVEQIRQKMFKDAIAGKIKEMQEKCDLEVAKREDERNHLPTQNLGDRELHDTMEKNIVETEFYANRMKSLKPEDLTVKPGESLGHALGRLDSYLAPKPKDLRGIKENQLTKKLVDEGVEKTKKGEVLTKADMDKAMKQEVQNLARPVIDQRNREENIRPVNRNPQPEQERVLQNRQPNNVL